MDQKIYACRGTDFDRQIVLRLSFYDLVDILKFSQLFFRQEGHFGTRNLALPVDMLRPPAREVLGNNLAAPAPCVIATRQTWTLLEKSSIQDWDDESEPHVCIVSSIRALAESLFVDDSTVIRIEVSGSSHADEAYRQTTPRPLSNKRTRISGAHSSRVHLVAHSSRLDTSTFRDEGGIYVLVDLKTMLTGIVVSASASDRFLNLVSRIVQENVWIEVTRAISFPMKDRVPHRRGRSHPTLSFYKKSYPDKRNEIER